MYLGWLEYCQALKSHSVVFQGVLKALLEYVAKINLNENKIKRYDVIVWKLLQQNFNPYVTLKN